MVGVATLRLLLVTSYFTLSTVTLMTGSSLIDLRSGDSITRFTDCIRLTSSDRSQVLAALQLPEQPVMHTWLTAELHTAGLELQDRVVNRSASDWFTFQPLASIVNFFSGSMRSKLVTSELMSPQPGTAR